ncbi:MAG: nitrate reductase subunit beta, partial [Actinomycetota bacterium]|nr:nitrate reductase subunit beta [Actinomycetota bacterium]
KLAAMRSHMRAVNLGEVPDPAIVASVGMTEEELLDMYRLLAIAKYDDRYVIPTAHQEQAGALEEAALAGCSLDFDGGPGMGATAVGERQPVPVAIESFHAAKQRASAERYEDLPESGEGTPR